MVVVSTVVPVPVVGVEGSVPVAVDVADGDRPITLQRQTRNSARTVSGRMAVHWMPVGQAVRGVRSKAGLYKPVPGGRRRVATAVAHCLLYTAGAPAICKPCQEPQDRLSAALVDEFIELVCN